MSPRAPVFGVVAAGAVLAAACVLAPYRAQGKACDAEHPCPDALACIAGVCGECATAADCGAAQVCAQGACTTCDAANPCPSGETCSAGACTASCSATLQSLVDAAQAGAGVGVPACTYRETVTLSKAVVLAGRPGAELRGSDVFSTWTASGGRFTGGTVPPLAAFGACATGQTRCRWPEQVFFDGKPLRQVASNPVAGEFALATDRSVILADDPNGHVVEVSVRRRWITTRSDDVTVRGLTFRHAASGADGAISNDGFSQWTLERSHLLDSHGPLVAVDRGTGIAVRDDVLERAGQVGVSVAGATGVTLERNVVSDANTEAFDPEGVAGGISASTVSGLVVRGNAVGKNLGRGIACLQDCTDATVEGNRVDHSLWTGIWFGASDHGVIRDNVVWESGWSDSVWGWGGGLLVWCSSSVDVGGNLVAWSADGITVISQGQTDPRWLVKDVVVHDNAVFGTVDPKETTLWSLSLGWMEDWSGALFAPASGNRGADNRFWSDTPESSGQWRFSWNSEANGITSLSAFAQTPGGMGSAYLTTEEKRALLTDAGVPAAAEAH